MKITYVTHSCIMVEIANTVILTDPWLTGPSWGGDLCTSLNIILI